MQFENRTEAGKLLAEQLGVYASREDVVVLGLPRGGVPVAYQVAEALDVPLDVFLVRKLGVPGFRELAMGAIAMGGVRVLNPSVIRELSISEESIDEVAREEEQELNKRSVAYRGHSSAPVVKGKVVLLVDDGIATGSTVRAAVKALKTMRPTRIVVAVPTMALAAYRELRKEMDDLVALVKSADFYAVGQWYRDFSQTTDQEVIDCLERARRRVEGKEGTGQRSAADAG